MLRSLNTGVTGLRNHQIKIDVIGNNVANVNTVGYKAQRIEFENLMSQTIANGAAPVGNRGGTDPEQIGLGVTTGAITSIENQGTLQFTGKNTDMAITGDGFFIVNDGQGNRYTRDGSFDFDRDGSFVQPATGAKVLGWTASNGRIDPAAVPSPIVIPQGQHIPAQGTANIVLKGNIKADTNDILIDGVLKGSSVPGATPATVVSGCKLLTSKNDVIHGRLTFKPLPGTLSWDVTFDLDSGAPTNATEKTWLQNTAPVDLGVVTFDTSGKMMNNSLQALALNFSPTYGASPITANVVPSQLSVRTDVTNSQIGLPPDPSNAADTMPAGAAGEVWAGSYGMTVNFYDGLGNAHSGTFVMSRDLDQQAAAAATPGTPLKWRASFSDTDSAIKDDVAGVGTAGGGPIPIDLGSMTFDQSGLPLSRNLLPLTLKYANGSADSHIGFDPGKTGDINGLTQFVTSSTALMDAQDGYPPGVLQSVTTNVEGVMTGIFSNGQVRQLAQLAVATFNNPSGLNSIGNNLLEQGNNSGEPQVGTAGNAGRGTVSAGSLEQSNVDLAESFSDLITTQRGFQANSRLITTSDEILQELIQLKR